MDRIIATVLKVNGTVFVRSEDGSIRALKPGDKIYEGEILITDDGGSVELQMLDGSIVPVDENREIKMIGQFVDQARESREEAESDDGSKDDPFAGEEARKAEENIEYPYVQHGYIRVEKGEAPPDSPDYRFVSINSSYDSSLEGRAANADPLMDGRATHDPRIELSLAPPDRQEQEAVVRIFREFEGSEPRIFDTQPEIGIPENAIVDEDDLVPDGTDQSDDPVDGGSLAVIPGDEGIDTFFDGNTPPAGLTSAGEEVKYYVSPDGYTLIGYTGDLPPGGAPENDQKVFEVVINNPDSQSGEQSYTYTQFDQLDHPDADGENQLVLTFRFTAEDIDGDSVSSSFTVTVVDDVPTARPDTDSVSEDGPLTATGNVVDSTDNGEDDTIGADNDGVAPVTGVAAGSDTSSAVSGNVGTSVTGSYGSVEIDANGDYTYTLDNTNPAVQGLDDTESLTDTFVYTITDADGDQSTTTLTITINGKTDEGPIVVDETIHVSEEGLVGGNPDTDPSGIDTTNAKEVSGTASFTDADSPAGSVFSAELSAVGLPTDWKSGGQSISWSIESGSGDLVGTTSSEEIIRVHIDNVDSSAREVNYTVTLQGPIDHPDATIEDNLSFDVPLIVKDELDNPGTGVITVTIEDDSPDQADSISQGYVEEEALQPEGNLDTNDHPNMEDDGDGNNAVWSSSVSGLFSIGADRPGSYSINSSVNGTAVVTTGGDAVTSGEAAVTYNVVNATTLQGVADGRVVFEVVLDQSTGDYTFTLEDQLDHHPVESADDIEGYLNLELSGTITVQDEDDDTVGLDANSLVITVQDDVPVDIDPDDAFMSNVAGTTVTEPLDYFGNIGADEPGTVKFLQSYDGALLLDSGGDPVQSEGKSVVLVLSADGTVLTGYLESETTPGDPDLSEPVIQITLNPDGDTQANDIYTVELFKKIDDGSGTDFNDFSQVTAGNNKWIGIDGDGVPINSVSDPDTNSRDLLITPIDPADTINNDSDDIAVSNQWIDNGEGIRIDFVQGLDYATGQDQSDPWNGVPAPFDYSAHYESNSFEFKIIQVQTSGGTANVRISAVNADDDDFLTGDAGDVSVLISASDVSVESTGTITITQDGNDVVVTGLEAGDKIYFSTDDAFDRVLVSNDGGADDFALGAFGVSTVRAGSPVSMDFDVEITDADGDKAGGDFTVTLDSPVLVVGKNVDDVDGQTEDHAVPNPNLDSAGEIVGGSANDILVGDIGGSSVEGKDLNLVIVIDTSGSMAFAFDGGVPNEPGEQSRLTILKESVNELLDELAAGDAENIRVHIVEYSGWPQSGYPGHSQTEPDAWVVGTYDLKTDGSANATELSDAKSDVNALNAEGGTNYEAGLQQAISWWSNPANPLSGDNVVNQTIFLSDGEPTFWYSGNSSNLTIGPGGFYHSDALAHITGTHTVRNPSYDPSSNWQDTVSEVDLLNSYGIVESVAINLPDNSSGLDVMDVIEGESPGSGASDNVKNPEDLSEVLQDISPLNKLADAGGDTVVGNEGADIIFGDALFTDTLAANQGLDMNPGSGYQVFRALENGESTVSPDWSRDDTINYIVNNMEELSQESVTSEGKRQGANDTIFGGEGNDIIYGQEGDDVIHGGDDNDYLDGGSGADELYGDDGDDVLIYDSADTVVDGGAGIDILRLENGDDIDFDLLVPNPIDNIEVIDLDNDIDANSLSNLSSQDVLDMTDSDNELFIIGDNGDSVSGSGSWNAQGSQNIGGVNYDVYTGTSNSQTVTLYVQDTINDSF